MDWSHCWLREPRIGCVCLTIRESQMARFFLVLFQTGFRGDRRGILNRIVFQEIQSKLDATIRTPPNETEIDIWLESPGGDAHVAFKLFLDIQIRCRKLRAVIPDF